MKICSKCHKAQSIDNYNIQRSAKDGHCAYCRECQREYNRAMRTPEKRKALYYSNHEANLAYQQAWRDANRDTLNAGQRAAKRKMRQFVIDKYGGKCECCSESIYEFLAIDHVNGGGRREREVLTSQQLFYKLAKDPISNEYRVLCHNCNQSYGYNNYCPHRQ